MLGGGVVAFNSRERKSCRKDIALASTYTRPEFEKFDDMADQLLLDPIHQIDERGWPQSKPFAA